jgi:hypothetical protein
VCAIGYIAARIIECAFILVGILSVLAVASLQESTSAGTDATLGSIAYTLAAIKDWTFLLGPGFVVGVGNGLLLGYLMYKSELVPRRMAQLGLVAGPLICVSGVLVMFGVGQPGGPMQGIATIPEFIWELCLGIYPIVWGFRNAPILRGGRRAEMGAPHGTPAVAST